MQKYASSFSRDFAASLVVFLVAMPLCLGIAIASGVPVAMGLISGVIGGIVVGFLAGSPLQVTGPAAGLAVIVFGFVQEYGIAMLGPVLVLAGIIQIAAGFLRMGSWFRSISPAVVHGMLTGIGILIILGQIHVLMGSAPAAHATDNIAAMDESVSRVLGDTVSSETLALLIGLISLLAMLGWEKMRPTSLALVPGALIGVGAGTVLTALMNLPIPRVEVPDSIFSSIALPTVENFARMTEPGLIVAAVVIAIIASAETLLSAAAVDRMHDGERTRLNKELFAQGVGNGLCGVLGGLPITGVIVRSSANVQAGARTRASTIMHGIWILALIAALPGLLGLVPLTALAAVLLVTGWRLIGIHHVRELLTNHGFFPVAIWVATVVMVVTHDLLVGVGIGLALSLVEVLPWLVRRFSIRRTEQGDAIRLGLDGAATCRSVPAMLETLENLPEGRKVCLDGQKLNYMDHTSAETICEWVRRETRAGRPVEVLAPQQSDPRIGRIFARLSSETA
ncbi:SulP family inorganic anion transporter [Paracoccus shanxieyensis]|uniref:SulP family inorganic anion transporter n=1 Tax=Paracoccus shanxieyensis TaxID=2675752 RepID=A0A6L6IYN3_9RHOB|nr:SulP family inorganic anion transporter [Paracoccus shanxieyensis]MTH64200.1 SulP family inorganic anion transporter [Paracoccus shanxieyensis]MTH87344.1 SulP family inorganic anion transporter [Paracoccus shanxieyensis]